MSSCNSTTSQALVAHDCRNWHADDQERWKELFDPARIWGEPIWVRQTQYQNAGVYSRYLAAVRQGGARTPRFITPRGLQCFIISAEAVGCCPRTIAGYAWALYKMAGLLWPARERIWLVQTCTRLHVEAERTSKLKIHRIVDAGELLWVADNCLSRARAMARRGREATMLFRSGLYILVGVHMPERLRALASLRLEQIDLEENGVAFTAKAIKMKRDRPWVLPPGVMEVVTEWLLDWRAPWIASRPEAPSRANQHDFFWIGNGGGPVGDAALTEALRQVTEAYFGFPVTSHRFRDAAATLLMQRNAGNASVARAILGQRSEHMLTEYIETANQVAAGKALGDSLEAAEADLRRRVRAVSRSTVALSPSSRRRQRQIA
jgi:integrase